MTTTQPSPQKRSPCLTKKHSLTFFNFNTRATSTAGSMNEQSTVSLTFLVMLEAFSGLSGLLAIT
jgi:hypothetical protein